MGKKQKINLKNEGDLKKNIEEISFILNKNFYDVGCVKETLKDFKNACVGKINEKNRNINITLKPKDEKTKSILKYEFCNYILGLMKNKTIV